MNKKRSFDHILLNYVIQDKWNTSTNKMFNHEEKKVESPKEVRISNDLYSPLSFFQNTESNIINNKPPNKTRVLKFQASNDKTRIWKVEIIPVQTSGGTIRRYDSIITPSNESSSKWPIGSKHAADLYVKRLKDMFTANGKTKLITDQEMDYPTYNSQIRQTQPGMNQVPSQSNQVPTQNQTGTYTNPNVSQPQQTIIVQPQRVPMNIVQTQRVQQPSQQTQRQGINVIQKQPESPRTNGGNTQTQYPPYRNGNQRNPQTPQSQIPQRKFPQQIPTTQGQIPPNNFPTVTSPNIRFPSVQSPIQYPVNMTTIQRVQNPYQTNQTINPQNPYLPNR